MEDTTTLHEVLGLLCESGIQSSFFGVGASPDLKDSAMNVAWFTEGGLGLPDRDFYFNEGNYHMIGM